VRRRGSDIYSPARLSDLERRTAHIPAADLLEALGPHVTEARTRRMAEVFDARVGSVNVLMDAPYDPHNGSAILRTLDAFGVQDLHVIERQAPFAAHASVSRGSQKWIDVHTYADSPAALAALDGFELVATHPEGTLVPEDLGAIPRLCLVMGNEQRGIAEDVLARCTRSVRVPMRGFAESLNVSVTAAILLHGAVHARPGDLSADRKARLMARGMLTSLAHAAELLMARGLLPHEPSPPPRPHPTGKK
jgi:tRNA (guanosine-2'-O-)-methyltransferase